MNSKRRTGDPAISQHDNRRRPFRRIVWGDQDPAPVWRASTLTFEALCVLVGHVAGIKRQCGERRL